MHELGILDAMIHTIEHTLADEPEGTQVVKIVVEVGEISGIVPKYLEDCWPAARYNTSMEETELELHIVPGMVKCQDCGRIFNATAEDLACPDCKSHHMEMLSGNDMIISEIVVL